VMMVMKKNFGGQNIYFPTGAFGINNEKSISTYKQFQAGKTIPELAFETGHSVQWVYRLIANGRALCKAKRARSGKC
jgi:Mor family transcriptional regulator